VKKLLILISLTAMIGSPQATAQETSVTDLDPNHLVRGIEFGAGYYVVQGLNFKYAAGTTDVEESYDGGSSASFLLRYSKIVEEGFGFNIGAVFELPRTFKGVTVKTETGEMNVTESSQFSNFVIEANATFSFERAYVFLGPNYSMPFSVGGFRGAAFGGDFGGQGGIGWPIGTGLSNLDFGGGRITIELAVQYYRYFVKDYRVQANVVGGGSQFVDITTDDGSMTGGSLRLLYNFP